MVEICQVENTISPEKKETRTFQHSICRQVSPFPDKPSHGIGLPLSDTLPSRLKFRDYQLINW